ncbi:MAG: DUF2203 domain-containing protein [Candidatus Omnitrophica bacterium]|nr:DUF2203 domain-containing protein [Candidatus Omnitrophota bacterium]
MNPKIFTVEEARVLLPQVSSALTRLQEKKREIDLKQIEIDLMEIISAAPSQTTGIVQQKSDERMTLLNRLVTEYTGLFEEIESWGPVIKDVDQGLMDFYHVRDQQLVFLCWKLGESKLEYWHDLENGFQGRRPL